MNDSRAKPWEYNGLEGAEAWGPQPGNGRSWEEPSHEFGHYEHDDEDDDEEKIDEEFPQGRKLFVGGLGWDTHRRHLEEYFSQFGTVEQAQVMHNRDTGVSRGFGFVTFENAASAHAAQAQKHHRIFNKTAELKFAVQMGDLVVPTFEEKLAKQIFVGGLPLDATADELKGWAQHLFGVVSVASAIVVLDIKTKAPRGFGFVSFKTADLAEIALDTVPDPCEFRPSAPPVQVKRAHKRAYDRNPRKSSKPQSTGRRDRRDRHRGGKGGKGDGPAGHGGASYHDGPPPEYSPYYGEPPQQQYAQWAHQPMMASRDPTYSQGPVGAQQMRPPPGQAQHSLFDHAMFDRRPGGAGRRNPGELTNGNDFIDGLLRETQGLRKAGMQ